MSSINITKTFKIGGVLTDMDAHPTLSDAGAVYGIKNSLTDAVVVAAATAMEPADTGTYTYALTDVDAGTYTMSMKYIYDGDTYYTTSTIVVPETPPEVEDVAAVYTFGGLVLRLAEALGVAYYGAAGTTVAAVPVDVHDLDRCKRIVNAGVRMYLADAPMAGWRWANPVASVSLWPDVAEVATSTITGVHTSFTTMTATVAAGTIPFYPSMVNKTLELATTGDVTIAGYTSATKVTVTGDYEAAAEMFAIASGGAFTLPETFGGEFSGDINFTAGSNLGEKIEWTNAATVRRLMESGAGDTGTPRLAAVEKMALSRRWQLLV
ncbi:MAG: hypothetical protein IMZ55_11470, partial [Acidobacteria bacterium]|nr:hypothetical protein [Acidobacteriota bacterium]